MARSCTFVLRVTRKHDTDSKAKRMLNATQSILRFGCWVRAEFHLCICPSPMMRISPLSRSSPRFNDVCLSCMCHPGVDLYDVIRPALKRHTTTRRVVYVTTRVGESKRALFKKNFFFLCGRCKVGKLPFALSLLQAFSEKYGRV